MTTPNISVTGPDLIRAKQHFLDGVSTFRTQATTANDNEAYLQSIWLGDAEGASNTFHAEFVKWSEAFEGVVKALEEIATIMQENVNVFDLTEQEQRDIANGAYPGIDPSMVGGLPGLS